MKTRGILFILLTIINFGYCQDSEKQKVHSHNDYLKTVPFWDAYSAGASSIEVDLFLKNNKLYATHDEKDIIENRLFENLYLEPLQKAYDLGLGEMQNLILLIDIKSEAYNTLKAVIQVLEEYPTLIKNKKIKFVISGNRPNVSDYINYPDFIYFDYQSLDANLTQNQKQRIGLISLNFKKYLKWDGKQEISQIDYYKLKAIVAEAHQFKKEFRFWGIPDTKMSWQLFSKMGVDYINTDNALKCVTFFKTTNDGDDY
ncbi:hypothetical protein APS56_06225 [Pseudalgibacter alginicilyticus]|uniref:Alkaline phosphatase n=1 Tax=Pseudalgibacter alginicilyticus TaxID=1736674 RepID=A0A0P0D9W9_9FLAO|nr:hypothetical protein [Pseudalgibacter alginicilyticus]ALJ04746.1 hypothetical protein APS56_06225 [Pseudalgibacter alginicilyticus]